MRAIANAVGATLGVERHCEPDLALAAGCGRALRQHNSCTIRERDGAVGGSLQPQIAAFKVQIWQCSERLPAGALCQQQSLFQSPELAMFRDSPSVGPCSQHHSPHVRDGAIGGPCS